MDKQRVSRPKWPQRSIGILMMVAGVVVFFADWKSEEAIRAFGYIGIALIVLGSLISSTLRIPPADD